MVKTGTFALLVFLVGCSSDSDKNSDASGGNGGAAGDVSNAQGGNAGNAQGGNAGNAQGGNAGNAQGGNAGNAQGGNAGNTQGGTGGIGFVKDYGTFCAKQEDCEGTDATYCLINPTDPTQAFCTTLNCVADDCTGELECCDCTASAAFKNVWTAPLCLPPATATVAASAGCSCS